MKRIKLRLEVDTDNERKHLLNVFQMFPPLKNKETSACRNRAVFPPWVAV